MRACGDAVLQFRVNRVRDKVRLGLVIGIWLVLSLEMVVGLAHFSFCHSSSPQKPASKQARVLQ